MKGKFPNRLQAFMDAADVGPTALARSVGTSKQNISRWADQSRKLPPEWAEKIAPFLGVQPQSLLFDDETLPVVRSVPLLSWVSAGKLAEATTPVPTEDVPMMAFAGLGGGDFFALTVRGDSMDRLSPEGSVIVINRQDKQLVSGKPYVFSVRGEATYKLWRPRPNRLAPYSTNPENEPIFVERQRDLEVVGRVKRTVLDL